MNSNQWVGLVAVAVLAGQMAVAADKPFETTVSLGVNLTDGNSETLQANGSLVTEGEKEGLGSVRVGVEGNYGESTINEETDTTVQNAKGFGNVKKTLSPMSFAYLDGNVLYDDIALIDYRVTVGPGLGVFLIKDDATKLSITVGASYIWEEVDNVTDDYASLRVAQRFERQLTATSKIWESVEYLPEFADFNNYLINAEIGAEAALNSRLNLRVVLQDKYDNQPAADLERNDLTLIAGIVFKL